MQLTRTPLWTAIFLETVDAVTRLARAPPRENLRVACNFWLSFAQVDSTDGFSVDTQIPNFHNRPTSSTSARREGLPSARLPALLALTWEDIMKLRFFVILLVASSRSEWYRRGAGRISGCPCTEEGRAKEG